MPVPWLLLAILPAACGMLQISLIVLGSDFINVTVTPKLNVNQLDLGDVYVSPCTPGYFSPNHLGICHPCSSCPAWQYEEGLCKAYADTVCLNCTVCGPTEIQVCPCGNVTAQCYTGDSVCLPTVPVSINLTFNMAVGAPLSVIQQRFLTEGLGSGFILFLSTYLDISDSDIFLVFATPVNPRLYQVEYFINNIYLPHTIALVRGMSETEIQLGLSNTFGIQSNTFTTRRRLLTAITLLVQNVQASCVSGSQCPQFFELLDPGDPCSTTCVGEPCPAGYTGDFGQCVMCSNATFKDTIGNDTCTACPLGFTSDSGATDASECRRLPSMTSTHGGQVVLTSTNRAMVSTTRAVTLSTVSVGTTHVLLGTTPAPSGGGEPGLPTSAIQMMPAISQPPSLVNQSSWAISQNSARETENIPSTTSMPILSQSTGLAVVASLTTTSTQSSSGSSGADQSGGMSYTLTNVKLSSSSSTTINNIIVIEKSSSGWGKGMMTLVLLGFLFVLYRMGKNLFLRTPYGYIPLAQEDPDGLWVIRHEIIIS
jgi:hypothetical protein